MSKISVIFVTNRYCYKEILADNMNRQTFRDFEVIVADENYNGGYSIFDVHFKPRQKLILDAWNVNKAYNDCLDRARGELLVFLQDYIWIPADGLQRFWDDYQKYPDALITGVGHKWNDTFTSIVEEDRRANGPEGVHVTDYMATAWELNWAACPRAIMPRFDERMDAYYGGENLYIQRKACLSGARMVIDRSNVCKAFSQDYCGGRPTDWEEKHANKDGRLAAFLKHLDLTT